MLQFNGIQQKNDWRGCNSALYEDDEGLPNSVTKNRAHVTDVLTPAGLQFHVLQFHALQLGPSISCPAISCPSFSATPMKCIVCKLFVSMSLFWQLIFDVAFLYSYITSGCCSIVIICSVHLTADCCSSTTTIIVWQDSILERGSAAFQRRPGWSKWVVNRKF